MRKISDFIEQYPSLESYLSSPDCRPDSSLKAQLSCSKHGFFSVQLPKSHQNWNRCWLVLVNAGDHSQRFLFPGTGTPSRLQFDLSNADDILFQQRLVWLGYLALDKGEDLLFSRLKQRGAPDSPAYQWSPTRQLAPENAKLIGPAAERKTVLTARLDSARNTLYFSAHPVSFLQALQDNTILHRLPAATAESWPFDFSVIMPVYNAAEYLAEAVDSVLEQDIGFEEHIQLILVDDGSTDGSPALCDAYARQYPRNVKVLHKPNGGVSSARNAGLSIAEGKYIHFMDSDDKISLNTYSSVLAFFDPNYFLCDLVAFPIFYFDGVSGNYYQNTKFSKGNRIINLWREPFTLHFHGTASIFKHEAIKGRTFNQEMPLSEDIRFITELLLEKMQLGVVSNCIRWYRKRPTCNSLVDSGAYNKDTYLRRHKLLVTHLQTLSRQKHGFVPKFVQYTLLTEYQFRLHMKEIPSGVLNRWEEYAFRRSLLDLIKSCDDDVIMRLPQPRVYRVLMFRLKYGKPLRFETSPMQGYLFSGDTLIHYLSSQPVNIDLMELEDHTLTLEGYLPLYGLPEGADVRIYLQAGSSFFPCPKTDRQLEPHRSLFGDASSLYPFKGSLPIIESYLDQPIYLILSVNGHLIRLDNYRYGVLCPVCGLYQHQYYAKDGYVLTATGKEFRLQLQSLPREEYEARFMEELETFIWQEDPLFPKPLQKTDLTRELYEEIVEIRKAAIAFDKKRPIWLISDRVSIADDNGAALFRHLMKQKDLPADVYFVLSKDSPDYERMSAVGPVLDYHSQEHLIMHLNADLVISSQFNLYVRYPFSRDLSLWDQVKYYCDMTGTQHHVFLQHGITQNDLSSLLNRYRKNFSGFVTAASAEYQSILDYGYDYEQAQVWLTGFPRFDLLYENSKKLVTLCFTWRRHLDGLNTAQFAETDFFRFYEELISDPTLQNCLKTHGYELCIKLHPDLLKHEELFRKLPVTILPPEEPYRKMFAESDLLVTDYSSAVMDFAYLRKPVVYFQFDRKDFFERQYVAGYFDYCRNGFGPVTSTVEETVSQILSIIDNGCTMSGEYKARADAFFLPRDTDNCARVYQKLAELQENLNNK